MKHLLLTTIAAVLLATTAFAGPIHDAAMRGDLAGVQAELDKGVDVNAKELWGPSPGSTPLHHAASKGHKEIAELLIAKGADVNAMDGGQQTPLDWANDELADLLRKHGAKTKVELEPAGTTKGFDENSLPVSVAPATRAERN